jgi:hypothetical protein
MKNTNLKNAFLFILFSTTTFSFTPCIAKNSFDLDLTDSLEVVQYIMNSTICDKILYVQNNLNLFIGEDSYAHLILIEISKETNKRIIIPKYNYYADKVSNVRQEAYLSSQMEFFIIELCKIENK